jgi:hypothetical protein
LGGGQDEHPKQGFMKIRILASASRDLMDGYRFYEMQSAGVGAYFLDSLFSDIDSLILPAVVARFNRELG